MNLPLVFLLFLIISVFFLETAAELFNLRQLKEPLPQEFQRIYDPIQYEKTLSYQRENVYFELTQQLSSLIIFIIFLMTGGFDFVDSLARTFQLNSIATGLIFVGILVFLQSLLQLPFDVYHTFVIETKYGLNTTSVKVFLLDLIKGFVLASLLGGLILTGVFYFFEHTGPNAWLYCWLTFTLFQLIIQYLAPVLIMPLFNKFSPLPEGELLRAIEKFAHKRHFQLSGIFSMDSSKRTTKTNAFFAGFGKFKKLVLFDTLIQKHSIDEIIAILAHEIGHFEKKHILKSLILSIASSGVIFYLFSRLINNEAIFKAFQVEHLSIYASIIFISIVASPFLRIFSIFTHLLSRKYEFEADQFAIQTSGNPEVLISALKKLSMDNLSHLTPHPLKILLDYSHPPILKRIERIRSRSLTPKILL